MFDPFNLDKIHILYMITLNSVLFELISCYIFIQ